MDSSIGKSPMHIERSEKISTLTEQLIQAQVTDPKFTLLLWDDMDMAEAANVPTCLYAYKRSGVLMRK